MYRYLIDLGADAIISHHSHVFSGYEVYQGKPIFYGLGNFIYDWPGKAHAGWNRGYIVKLNLAEKVVFEIIPFKQGEEYTGVFHLDPMEKRTFFKELQMLNLIISDKQLLEEEFNTYCSGIFPTYNAFIEPNLGRYLGYIRRKKLIPRIFAGKKRRLLLNLIRCESHREVLIRILENPS